MATLTLKNVPEGLVRLLKREAAENRRSLNQETLLRLEKSVKGTRREDPAEALAALAHLHRKMAHLQPIDEEYLQRAKGEGRS